MINVWNCAQSQPVRKQQGKSTLTLLIVEDVLADLELMILALETAEIQFTYDAVDNLSHCEQLLQTTSYDAVLADYRLPQFTAYQVLQVLQQSAQEIPLILVTGSLGEEAAVECIKAGMTDYVLKERLFRLPMVLQRSLQEFTLRHQQKTSIVRIHQQAQQQAIINRIVQAMRETLVLDEVLKSTVDALHEALKPSRCFISQPFQNEMWINHVSTATINRENFIGVKCLIYPHYQEAFQRGQIIVITRTDTSIPLALRDLVTSGDLNSALIAPLLYQQTLLGGIVLQQCDRDRVWTPDEISLLQAISNQCAIAIHQAQLFHQLQQQTQWEKALNQISRSLNSSLDPEHILQEIVRLTGECFAVDRVMIYALEHEEIKITREWRSSEKITSLIGYTTSLSEWKISTNFSPYKVFYAPQMEKICAHSKAVEIVKNVAHLTVLSVPIFIRDEFFGGLALHTITRVQEFTVEEIKLLQRIADKAAVALYNAQSYEILEKLVKKRTQELEAEKLLSDAANRTKTEFLSNMSHELRTPLTGILGFSSILIEEVFGTLNNKQKQYIEGIHTCGKHLLELINDLLDLTKIEAGKEELLLESLEVIEVCQECLALFEEKHSSELQLNFTIAPDVNTCVFDRRRLKQILVNLLSNAFKFTEFGSVTLKVEQTEAAVLFSVIDTGIGISPADQATLFQPFQQLDSGLDRKYEGTGLGLALSRKLARLHGGDITVQSHPRRGSCFTLTLPRSPYANQLS